MKESTNDQTTFSDEELSAKAQEELNMEGEMNEVSWTIRTHLLKESRRIVLSSFSQLYHCLVMSDTKHIWRKSEDFILLGSNNSVTFFVID